MQFNIDKTNSMEIKALMPRRGDVTLRIDDSDDLVVIKNVGVIPNGGSLPERGVC